MVRCERSKLETYSVGLRRRKGNFHAAFCSFAFSRGAHFAPFFKRPKVMRTINESTLQSADGRRRHGNANRTRRYTFLQKRKVATRSSVLWATKLRLHNVDFFFLLNQHKAILRKTIKVANGTICRQFFFVYRFYRHYILRVLSRELRIRPHKHIASAFADWTYVNKLRSTV